MTKKRLILIASLPLTIAVIIGVFAMLPPSPGVSKENFDRLKDGMTLAEVEEIFGEKHINASADFKIWVAGDKGNPDAYATVFFDENDCVFDGNPPRPGDITQRAWRPIGRESFLAKIRRWLHLQ